MAGGGLKMGQVIGQSDRQARAPTTEPYNPKHLLGTMMHTLFDVGKMRLDSGVPRAINQFAEQCQPIGPLYGLVASSLGLPGGPLSVSTRNAM